ncbi:MAG: hypothetical protein Q7V57_00090 [Actinomycetota bacterium]|nr:hypothetical protein [Actinomycetota bacterium]
MRATRKAVAFVATSALVAALAGCSDDGGVSTEQFVTSVDRICTTLSDGLAELAKPTGVDQVESVADDASQLVLDAVTALKGVQLPADSSAEVAAAKDLVDELDHLIDVLDDAASAAGDGDAATVDAKTAEFESGRAQVAELGGTIGADRCGVDPLFDELAPPVTTTPVTEPPVTTPTDPTGTSNKTIQPLATQLVPTGDLAFVDVTDALLQTWISVVDSSPTAQAAPGDVAGVEVVSGGILMARIFVFLPTDPLPFEILDDIGPTITDGNELTGDTINGFPGVTWTNAEGVTSFLGAQTTGDASYFLYAAGTSHDALVTAITGLWASIAG